MKLFKNKILIVDDQLINRLLLHKILDDTYDVIEADSGEKALQVLQKYHNSIKVVLLDLIMTGMDGYTCLQEIKANPKLCHIPVIITTQSEGIEVEIKALNLGAADYITKPYNNIIVLKRISNILTLSENAILRNINERDSLTHLYNKETFYKKVFELLRTNVSMQYSILYIDVERFKIVNDLFGMKEGDKLLRYIANILYSYSNAVDSICCRHNADIFVVCVPFEKEKTEKYISEIINEIVKYPLNFRLNINFGIYVIDNANIPVNIMCDRASLALQNVVGKYGENFAYYSDSDRDLLLEEQAIENEMTIALQEGQFHVYLQPKFDLRDFSIIGAEALVRWIHPAKGTIGPDKFIPIFERNGFITNLDTFVWETICVQLRKWIDNGWPIVPISVNVSRVDIYRPDICDVFSNLMTKYDLPTDLLELEITETAYTQNPEQLIDVVTELKLRGFSLSMDDFGSGYSSLNMLNEVPVDVLKIDMKLLKNINEQNRGSNIINFVVSLAKWLHLPVISEGVETIGQVSFLRSIGCFKGQGYFFAKPLTIEGFEEKLRTHKKKEINFKEPYSTFVTIDDIWDPISQFNNFFNFFVGSLALCERKGSTLSLIRANEQFYKNIMTDCDETCFSSVNLFDCIVDEDRALFLANLDKISMQNNEIVSDVRMNLPEMSLGWYRIYLKVVYKADTSTIYLAMLEDITSVRMLESDCAKNKQHLKNLLETCSINLFDVNFENKTLVSNNFDNKIYEFPAVIDNVAETFISTGFLHEPNADEIHTFFDNIFAGKQTKEILINRIKNDKTVQLTRLSSKVEFNELGLPVFAFCILTNI